MSLQRIDKVVLLVGLWLACPDLGFAQAYSRTDVLGYHNDTNAWVLGQVASVTCVAAIPASQVCNGDDVESVTTFDSVRAQPLTYSEFGKLKRTLTYNADGTVATVQDGNGNVIALSSWKRGIPQVIRHASTPESPAGATELAEVDNNGWIRSVTNEIGARTCYGYDQMGRINRITYPSEGSGSANCDDSAWAETTIEFRPMTAAEWRPPGVEAGQWRQYTATANYQKVVYMDASWRPVLTHEYDASNTSGTLRAVSTTYDAAGRVTFQSYPSSDLVPAANGTWTFYDGLGRTKEVRQDSEHGPLITKTDYLGNRTRVTGPDNEVTLTTFQAFDQPSFDTPVLVEEPLGRTTLIVRDPYGKPIEIERKL